MMLFVVFLISISIISLLIARLLKQRRLLQEKEQLISLKTTQSQFYRGLMDNCPGKWLIWTPAQDTFILDPRLSAYLALPDQCEITFDMFSGCFVPSDIELMKKKLQHLQVSGEGFEIKLTLNRDRTTSNFLTQDLAPGPYDSYVLWFRETLTPAEHSSRILSDNVLASVLNTVPLPIWVRGHDGRLMYCNKRYADILETTPELALREDTNLLPGKLTIDESGHRSLTEYTLINGIRHLLEYHEEDVDDIKSRVGYALDKTKVEQIQKELELLIVGHREVLENITPGVIIYGADKRTTYFNHAYIRMFDMDEPWLSTHPQMTEVLDNLYKRRLLTEQADFPAFKQKSLQLFKSLSSPVQELIHLPDERTIRAVTAPYPGGGLLCVFEDVTDSLIMQRQANTQLAVQKETLDHLYEGVAVFASDNRLKLINPAFARLWKLAPEFFEPGRHISEIVEQIKDYFDYGDDWESYKQKVIATFTDRVPKNGRLTRKDDAVLEFTYVPLPDGAHLVSYTDISDSYRAERALRERNHALEAADRVKSEFLHSFSFDLKAPINTIIGFSEILSDQYFGQLNKQQVTYCRGILEASNQLLRLVNDIIDLATIEAGQMNLNLQPIEPRSLLSSVASMVRKRTKNQQLSLSVSCGAELTEFIADERRLKQALINLIHNSIKFTPVGGKISLVATRIGNNVHLTVSDTGSGISKRDQKLIFRNYQRAEEAANRDEGMGMGLSLAKSLIELHGGRLVISSQKSSTKVTCVIPLNLQQTPQPKLPNMAIL